MLVPLLAFDRAGNRVGYGRGFYDKFLATLNCKKIGLSFFSPVKAIEGMSDKDKEVSSVTMEEQLRTYKEMGFSLKDAVKETSISSRVSKSQIYKEALKIWGKT